MTTFYRAIFQKIIIIQALAQQQCPQNSFYAIQFQSCVCNQSYFINFINNCEKCQTNSTSSAPQYQFQIKGLSCDICLPNFYYNERQNQYDVFFNQVPVCIECPSGTGTNQVNTQDSFLISSCNICLINYYMINPSSQSPTPSSAQCLPCPSSTLSSGAQIVDQSVCNSCAVNYYMAKNSIPPSQNNNNQGVAAQCLICPNGSGNLEGPNIQGDISQCSSCLENYYMVFPSIQSDQQIEPSAAQCLPCPSNSFNPKNSQQGFCTCYDQNATPLSSQVSSCNCKNGYSGSVATSPLSSSGCSRCPQGYYSNSSTSYKCMPCSSGSYINNDQSDCICNDKSIGVYFDPVSMACNCQKDYFGNPKIATLNTIGSCTPCPKKFFQVTSYQSEMMNSKCELLRKLQNLISFNLVLAAIQLFILV
ncbi:hypothetical protein ABPG72_017683 [Tetrahymena utriculariae]